MSVMLLTEQHLEVQSLEGGCTGSSESTLVKMQHCSKSHVTAQLFHDCDYLQKDGPMTSIKGLHSMALCPSIKM